MGTHGAWGFTDKEGKHLCCEVTMDGDEVVDSFNKFLDSISNMEILTSIEVDMMYINFDHVHEYGFTRENEQEFFFYINLKTKVLGISFLPSINYKTLNVFRKLLDQGWTIQQQWNCLQEDACLQNSVCGSCGGVMLAEECVSITRKSRTAGRPGSCIEVHKGCIQEGDEVNAEINWVSIVTAS